MEGNKRLLAAYREIIALIDENRSPEFIRKFIQFRMLATQLYEDALGQQFKEEDPDVPDQN
jgi:hypothetical protein